MTAPLQLPKPPPRRARRPHPGVRIFTGLLIASLLLVACCFMARALGAWLALPLFPT